MAQYKISFDRIGRNHAVPPMTADAPDPDTLPIATAAAISDAVWRYASNYLISRDFTVRTDMDAMTGTIDGGRFGRFVIEGVGG